MYLYIYKVSLQIPVLSSTRPSRCSLTVSGNEAEISYCGSRYKGIVHFNIELIKKSTVPACQIHNFCSTPEGRVYPYYVILYCLWGMGLPASLAICSGEGLYVFSIIFVADC